MSTQKSAPSPRNDDQAPAMPLDELARRMLSMPPQPKKKAEEKSVAQKPVK